MRIYRNNEQGFTLLEIVVVTGFIVLLVFVAASFLRPASYKVEMQNAQRRTGVAQIAQNLLRYKAETGHFPTNIPTDPIGIGSTDSQYDLCNYLVPAYIQDLPYDPLGGTKILGEAQTDAPCTTATLEYVTGYAIVRGADGAVAVSAPLAENNEKIEITVR